MSLSPLISHLIFYLSSSQSLFPSLSLIFSSLSSLSSSLSYPLLHFGYLKVTVTVYPRQFDILSTAQTLGNQLLDGSVCLSPLSPSISDDLHVSVATPPSLVHHLSGPDKTKKNNTQHTSTHMHTFTHIHIHIYIKIHVIMNHQGHNHSWNGSVICLHLINTRVKTSHSTCTSTVTLHVIEPRTHKKSNCFFFF